MNRARKLAVVTGLAALAVWWWSSDHATPRPGGLAGLAAGEQRAYDLTWDGTTVVDGSAILGGEGTYAGEVHVAARLIVRGLGRDGEATLVGYRLDDVTTATYAVIGQDALAGVDPTGGELIAALGPDGALRELRPDPAAAPAVDLLLRAIAQQSAVTVAPGEAWDAVEPSPTGVGRVRYQRGAAGAVTRTRTGYDSLAALPTACATCQEELDGRATIALDAAGGLRELVEVERLVVVEDGAARLDVANRFALRSSSVAVASRPRPRLDGRRVVAATGDDAEHADDASPADGWSLDRIGATVVRFIATGATPGEPAWMHGIAAYLRLHPEASGELLRMFAAPGLPIAGREMIASMLSAAGTAEAQTALRAGLDWMSGRYPDGEVVSVLSRVTLLETPTAETAAWLAGLRTDDDLDPEIVGAATLALGAAIGNLPDPAEAARHAETIRDQLVASDDAAERTTLLAALGNGGRPEDAEAIAALADDPDPGVRQHVTIALRKLDDATAVPTLVRLAGDDRASVRSAAIEMLGRRGIDAATAHRAAQAALAAGADGDEHSALVELLGTFAADPAVAATLRGMLDVVLQPEVLAMIRTALAAG